MKKRGADAEALRSTSGRVHGTSSVARKKGLISVGEVHTSANALRAAMATTRALASALSRSPSPPTPCTPWNTSQRCAKGWATAGFCTWADHVCSNA